MRVEQLGILLALAALVGCDSVDTAKVARASKPTPQPLGVLQGRDYSIEAYAGPVFTVLSADGEVLAELMSAEQLQANHPELYRKIEHVYAANLASAGHMEGSVPRSVGTIDTGSMKIMDATFVDPTLNHCPSK